MWVVEMDNGDGRGFEPTFKGAHNSRDSARFDLNDSRAFAMESEKFRIVKYVPETKG
jgi:hypothetical protein